MKLRPHNQLIALLTALFSVSLSSGALNAETIYVTDAWKFEMRESPCFQCKIAIYGLSSGTRLETTGEIEDTWIQVRTEGGTLGWMPENYLSPTPAARDSLEAAQENAKVSNAKARLASTQLQQVTQELEQAGIEIELNEVSSDDGLASIQAPRIIGNLATLGRQNKELLERSQLLQNELDLRVAEIDRLRDSEMKTFFVYGALAVLAGALLAVILPRIKPRKSSSEWA